MTWTKTPTKSTRLRVSSHKKPAYSVVTCLRLVSSQLQPNHISQDLLSAARTILTNQYDVANSADSLLVTNSADGVT